MILLQNFSNNKDYLIYDNVVSTPYEVFKIEDIDKLYKKIGLSKKQKKLIIQHFKENLKI